MVLLKQFTIIFLLFCLPYQTFAKIVFLSNRHGGNNSNIYVMDDNGRNVQRLTFTQRPHTDNQPEWSPDGTRILFSRDLSNHRLNQKYQLFVMDQDGRNVKQLTDNKVSTNGGKWAPDGQRIVFNHAETGGSEIYVMDIITQDVVQLTNNPKLFERAMSPAWSPNGRYIAYRQGLEQHIVTTIYVMNANGKGANPVVPIDEWYRFSPAWSPDSKSIIYFEALYVDGKGFTLKENRIVIQKHGLKERRFLKTPKQWLIHSVCWADYGKQVLIAASERNAPDDQIDIYKYHLLTEEITNVTNHPSDDYSMDWISDEIFSVTPNYKKKIQWGRLKK